MKQILLFLSLSILLVGCAKDETAPQGASEFAPETYDFNETVFTGAEEIGVYMVKADEDLAAGSLIASGKFVYDGTKFNPASGAMLYPKSSEYVDIIAYYPHSTLTNFVYSVDVSNQGDQKSIDLLYSENAKYKNDRDPAAELIFKHQLSKIWVKVGTEGYTQAEKDGMTAKMTGLPTKASFDLVSKNLSNYSSTVPAGDAVNLKRIVGADEFEAILLPTIGVVGYSDVKLEVTVGATVFTYVIDTDFVTTKYTLIEVNPSGQVALEPDNVQTWDWVFGSSLDTYDAGKEDITDRFLDPTFREYVVTKFGSGSGGAITRANALNVTDLGYFSDSSYPKPCKSLAGIEYFTNLDNIFISVSVDHIDLSKNKKLSRIYIALTESSNLSGEVNLSNFPNAKSIGLGSGTVKFRLPVTKVSMDNCPVLENIQLRFIAVKNGGLSLVNSGHASAKGGYVLQPVSTGITEFNTSMFPQMTGLELTQSLGDVYVDVSDIENLTTLSLSKTTLRELKIPEVALKLEKLAFSEVECDYLLQQMIPRVAPVLWNFEFMGVDLSQDVNESNMRNWGEIDVSNYPKLSWFTLLGGRVGPIRGLSNKSLLENIFIDIFCETGFLDISNNPKLILFQVGHGELDKKQTISVGDIDFTGTNNIAYFTLGGCHTKKIDMSGWSSLEEIGIFGCYGLKEVVMPNTQVVRFFAVNSGLKSIDLSGLDESVINDSGFCSIYGNAGDALGQFNIKLPAGMVTSTNPEIKPYWEYDGGYGGVTKTVTTKFIN